MADRTAKILRGTARAATYSVILQVSFRMLSFLVNGIVLRYVSRELLGLVNVRLTLLYSTVLLVSREAFRKACLSTLGVDEKDWRQLINLMWCCVPLGILIGFILGWVWIYLLEYPSHSYVDYYPRAVILFVMSAVSELVVEPLWLISQEFHFINAKIVIEAIALCVKCLSTLLIIVIFPEGDLCSFTVAQVMHSVFYIGLYYLYFLQHVARQSIVSNADQKSNRKTCGFPVRVLSDVLPHFTSNGDSYVDPSYASLVLSFFKQSLLKQFLSEGERYIMTVFNILSMSQQGVYDIINNLGSIAIRFIFLPIEESYYVLFSQLLIRGESNKSKEELHTAGRILFGVLKCVSLVGMIVVVFGFSYSYLALIFYGGDSLSSSEGPMLLKWYSVYVLIVAINGITECFMFALMSKGEIDDYNKRMMLFSFVFLAAAIFFSNMFGSAGLIMANCLNMIIRIIHSSVFIKQYFNNSILNPLYGVFPARMVICSLVLSFITTAWSEQVFCCNVGWLRRFIHIGIGGVCLLSVFISVWATDAEIVTFLKEQWRGKIQYVKKD